ncbi:polysaccharide deacetylase [Fulvivirga sp. RKSG066]|uniref:polysaccharide deacetylase family protein n=1 Tax=Fulvivirga aurantia TaxID=2529383 RepID=UPI0012BC5D73|nr:polysaccharide deacetylase family protein [Fulvivirga aurantia]MTI21794.1 polysaccharide deacetylase [Fulvivirga aurantia]
MFKNTLVTIILTLQFFGCSTQPSNQKEEIESDTNGNKEVVAFVYHRFGDSRFPSTNVSLEHFEAHLKYFKNNDYQVLTFSEAIEYLKSGQNVKKTAVITVDDGYKSFYKNGLPLLKQYGFPATLYINTKTVGGGDYMSWSDIKEAKKHNIEIGNHTHSHDYFLNKSENERYKIFEDEIALSQKLIEENTGEKPITFAYPYGELDPKMKAIVADFDFVAAAAQNSGVIYENSDLMQCPRFPMSEFYSAPAKFKEKIKMKALRVNEKQPHSSVINSNTERPELTLTFDKGNLQTGRLQCFIQGNDCDVKLTEQGDDISISISPKSALGKRRRTLYTITVPDSEGNWHWYSHLWVNPEVK